MEPSIPEVIGAHILAQWAVPSRWHHVECNYADVQCFHNVSLFLKMLHKSLGLLQKCPLPLSLPACQAVLSSAQSLLGLWSAAQENLLVRCVL